MSQALLDLVRRTVITVRWVPLENEASRVPQARLDLQLSGARPVVWGQLVRKRLPWRVIRDLEVFLKRDRRVKQGSLELQEIPLLVAQEPQDNEDYREKWGRLGRSELSVSRVLLVFLEFLARLDRPVHKVAWVLLGELVP